MKIKRVLLYSAELPTNTSSSNFLVAARSSIVTFRIGAFFFIANDVLPKNKLRVKLELLVCKMKAPTFVMELNKIKLLLEYLEQWTR